MRLQCAVLRARYQLWVSIAGCDPMATVPTGGLVMAKFLAETCWTKFHLKSLFWLSWKNYAPYCETVLGC
jgi:hypothetical protein